MQASKSDGRLPKACCMRATVSAATLRTVPSQPVCTITMANRTGSKSKMGTQSANRMSSVTSRRLQIMASAWIGGCAPRGPSASSTRLEWTCQTSNTDSGERFNAASARRLFSATRSGESPTVPPRFSERHGSGLVPPRRVNTAWFRLWRSRLSNWKSRSSPRWVKGMPAVYHLRLADSLAGHRQLGRDGRQSLTHALLDVGIRHPDIHDAEQGAGERSEKRRAFAGRQRIERENREQLTSTIQGDGQHSKQQPEGDWQRLDVLLERTEDKPRKEDAAIDGDVALAQCHLVPQPLVPAEGARRGIVQLIEAGGFAVGLERCAGEVAGIGGLLAEEEPAAEGKLVTERRVECVD